jgi:predicted DNA binding CopG/RHH family protein
MSPSSTRRHVIVSVSPRQLEAIKQDVTDYGLSRREIVQLLTEEFLHKPIPLIAGGAYRKPDRERLRVHIDESLHEAIADLAQRRGVPMTVIFTTAIHNCYPA